MLATFVLYNHCVKIDYKPIGVFRTFAAGYTLIGAVSFRGLVCVLKGVRSKRALQPSHVLNYFTGGGIFRCIFYAQCL